MAGAGPMGRQKGQFLDGDPTWWTAKPTKNEGEDSERARIERMHKGFAIRSAYDLDPPSSWKGWKRQREQPVLIRFLFPVAWSIMFLALGLLFTIFDENRGWSPWIGAAFCLSAPFLVFLTAFFLTSGSLVSNSTAFVWKSFTDYWNIGITSFMLMSIWWCWDSKLDPSDPFWFIFFFLSLGSWLWWTARASQALAAASGRWLLPVDRQTPLSREILEKAGWTWLQHHSMWAPAELGELRLGGQGRLILSGISIEGTDFLSLVWQMPHGWNWDPWQDPEQPLPMEGLVSLFSLTIDRESVLMALRSVDISSLSQGRNKWPEWCKPKPLPLLEEE